MKRYDDLPLFRPKTGGRVHGEQSPALRSFVRKAMKGVGKTPPRGGHARRGHRPAHVRPVPEGSRQVIVKARVVRMDIRGMSGAVAHEAYLQRDMIEREGTEGRFYGRHDAHDGSRFAAGSRGERHQFRIIVSPADAHELDLTGFTRELMGQVEKDLGRKIHWKAINHYNTDNPHVHVIVRGLDRKGLELWIDRDYISSGMRLRAQAIVTRELGLQSPWEREKAAAREMRLEGYTSLDASLGRMERGGVIDLGAYPEGVDGRVAQGRLLGRLQVLERLGLARRHGARSWKMDDAWRRTLVGMGERRRIFGEMHRAVQGNPSRYRIFDASIHGGVIEGRLAATGLAGELGDRYSCVIETPQGSAFYVRLKRGDGPVGLGKGAIVAVRAEPEDRSGAALAAGPGGGESAGKVQMRLVLKGVSPLSLIEQECYRGRTWLDRFTAGDGLRGFAGQGFGRDLALSLERRAGMLRGMGIDPADPGREGMLERIEEGDLARRLSASTGAAFRDASSGRGMRGVLSDAGMLPGGRRFAMIVDAASREFTLVPWREEFGRFAGRRVEMLMDHQAGLALVRGLALERGR